MRARQQGSDKANIVDESPSEFVFFGGMRNLAIFFKLKNGITFFFLKKRAKIRQTCFQFKKKKKIQISIFYIIDSNM
jgi:hypothetical protein